MPNQFLINPFDDLSREILIAWNNCRKRNRELAIQEKQKKD